MVQSIVVNGISNKTSATLDDQNDPHMFWAQIDSKLPYLWLPDEIVNNLADIFGLTYDETTDLYPINATQRSVNLENEYNITF